MNIKDLKISEFKIILKESVAAHVAGLKNQDAKNDLEKAKALLKILDEQIKAYEKLVNEAEKLHKKIEDKGIETEWNNLKTTLEDKKSKRVQVETKIKSLEAQIKGGAPKPSSDKKSKEV